MQACCHTRRSAPSSNVVPQHTRAKASCASNNPKGLREDTLQAKEVERSTTPLVCLLSVCHILPCPLLATKSCRRCVLQHTVLSNPNLANSATKSHQAYVSAFTSLCLAIGMLTRHCKEVKVLLPQQRPLWYRGCCVVMSRQNNLAHNLLLLRLARRARRCRWGRRLL